MRLLVTGAAGMLGRDVAAVAERAGHEVAALARRELDLARPETIAAALDRHAPDAVINCAAWTDVDGAEAAEAEATAVNGAGAGAVAAAAAARGAFVVQVSSDYVFSGTAREPYREDAPVGPRSAYGRSKLAGEGAVAAAAPGAHAIVRTAWLFGPGGRNFVDTMLRLAGERDEVTVVDDQVGCPTFSGHLAPALVAVAEHRPTGVLHVAGGGGCSWHALAREVFAQAGLSTRVLPGRTADLGRPAPRPAFSVLASTRADAPVLPPWREGVAAHLALRAAGVTT